MPDYDLAADPLLASVPTVEGYKVLGGVAIYQKLGQGGMGAVYKGRHIRLDIDVALKVMALPPGTPQDQADAFIKRFIREAKTAAAINHPNLVRVTDVNTEAGVYYLVMDYVDGESAAARLKRKGRLEEVEAVEICLGAALGLAEAHRKGIVHRDVKPDNIMIDKEGHVRVTDLGLAKARSSDDEGGISFLTATQVAMGTPHYMSPEQFTSARTVGPQADVWSLGVTLFHLLTGRPPWNDTSIFSLARKIDSEPFPDPRSVRADLSEGICAIIERSLKKDPAERYADCAEMASALQAHLDSLGPRPQGALADQQAGATKLALVSMPPPPARTLTLIARSGLGAVTPVTHPRPFAPQATPATIAPSRPAAAAARSSSWVVPLVLVLLALVAGAATAAYFFGRGSTGGEAMVAQIPPPTPPPRQEPEPPQAAQTAPTTETTPSVEKVEQVESTEGPPAPGQEEEPQESQDARLETLLAAARAFREADLLEKAREKLVEALELAPDSQEAKQALAEVQKELASRLQMQERAAEYKKWTDRALELKLAGKYLEAAEAYRKAAEYAPPFSTDAKTSAEACMHDHFRALASQAMARLDFQGAIDLYSKALEYADRPDTRAELAEAKRRLDAARQEISKKQEAERLKASAEEAERAGDIKLALERYRAASKLGADVGDRIRRLEAELAAAEAEAVALRKRQEALASREERSRQDVLELGGGVTLELVELRPGRFIMGSADGAVDEKPVREVEISQPFRLGRYEVTRGQFARFVAESGYKTEAEREGWGFVWVGLSWQRRAGASWRNPGFPQDDSHPVVLVTWNDAKAFCDWLSKKTGLRCRLPYEAEWEYACRAGTRTRYCWGDAPEAGRGWLNAADLTAKKQFPNWTAIFNWEDGHVYTAPVGSFRANAWGLSDMHGNVWEWCADYYDKNYYSSGSKRDPRGPASGTMRVLRGGSWNDRPQTCTASVRSGNAPNMRLNVLGFRVAADGG